MEERVAVRCPAQGRFRELAGPLTTHAMRRMPHALLPMYHGNVTGATRRGARRGRPV